MTDLAEDLTFKNNLAALRDINPQVASRLEGLKLSEEAQLFIVEGQEFSHSLNLAWQGVPLHRLEDPYTEAQEIFEAIVPESARSHQVVIFQYGLGLGYFTMAHVEIGTCSRSAVSQ